MKPNSPFSISSLKYFFFICFISVVLLNPTYGQESIVRPFFINKNAAKKSINSISNTLSWLQNEVEINEIVKDNPEKLLIEIPFNTGVSKKLILNKYSVLSEGAQIIKATKYGNEVVPFKNKFAAYYGYIEGEPDAKVSLNFSPEISKGLISTGPMNLSLEAVSTEMKELQAVDQSIEYPPTNPNSISVDDMTDLPESIIELMKTLVGKGIYSKNQYSSLLEVEVAIEADYELYLAFNENIDHAVSYLLGLIATLSQIYEREMQIKLTVTYVRVWAQPDTPYERTYTGSLLAQLRDYWEMNMQHINRDITYYITSNNDLPGRSISYINGIQIPFLGYGVVQNNLWYAQMPVYSEDVFQLAHEMGHSLGSPHTHDCNWPGGPIDFCYSTAGDCYTGPIIQSTGTIMSYCYYRSLTFHPLVKELIRTNLEAAANVKVIDIAPKTPVLVHPLNETQNVSTSLFFDWNSVSGANKYRIQVDTNLNFANPIINSTTMIARFQWSGLKESTLFYWRISASNEFGDGPWSETWKFTTQKVIAPATPTPLFPEQGDIGITKGFTFVWQPSTGAQSYRLQVGSAWYFVNNLTPEVDVIVNDTFYKVEDFISGNENIWRVKALNDEGESSWSAYSFFWMADLPHLLFPKFYGDAFYAPLSCPFLWTAPAFSENSWFQISKSSSFANPVVDQKDISNPNPSLSQEYRKLFMADLEPNTTYFWRVNQQYSDSINSFVLSGWSQPISFTTTSTDPYQSHYYNTATKDLKSDFNFWIKIEDPENIWVPSEGGLAHFNGSIWSFYDIRGIGDIYENVNLGELAIDKTNKIIWAAGTIGNNILAPENGLFKFDGLEWELISSPDLPAAHISEMVVDSEQNLWLATVEGLVKYDGSNFEVYNNSNSGLPSNGLQSLLIDPDGVLWIGTANAELVRFDGTNWTVYNAGNSSLPGTIIEMLMDKNGTLWFVCWPGNVASFDGNTWNIYEKPILEAWNIAMDEKGIIWIGGNFNYGELAWFDGEKWIKYRPDILMLYISGGIMDFAIDANGKFWIAGYGTGLMSFDPNLNATNVEQLEEDTHNWFELYQNFPNPFNSVTAISFDIAHEGEVSLCVNDAMGKEIICLVNQYYPPGQYTINWDATNLPAGIYFYRMQVGKFIKVKKMLVVR